MVDHPEHLLEEARRCERISLGIGDSILARQLLEWAADYRARWAALAIVLGADIEHDDDAVDQRPTRAA
jgi:hypothetical protein